MRSGFLAMKIERLQAILKEGERIIGVGLYHQHGDPSAYSRILACEDFAKRAQQLWIRLTHDLLHRRLMLLRIDADQLLQKIFIDPAIFTAHRRGQGQEPADQQEEGRPQTIAREHRVHLSKHYRRRVKSTMKRAP